MTKYLNRCRVKTTTKPSDISLADFSVTTSTRLVSGSDWDIYVQIKPKELFNDVASMVSAGNCDLFDDQNAALPVASLAGPNTTDAPDMITLLFTPVTQTLTNVGNTWKVVITNLVVNPKDGGAPITIPSVTFTFPSPM